MFAETPDIPVTFMVAETKFIKYFFFIQKNNYLIQRQLYSLGNYLKLKKRSITSFPCHLSLSTSINLLKLGVGQNINECAIKTGRRSNFMTDINGIFLNVYFFSNLSFDKNFL